MRPKVSITVPVYNVEKYLSRCIESLINQTLKDIEIILVDDGSPDSCGEICDYYAKIDDRIRVVHKSNGGLASARQAGLVLVRGEYYTVCDSDDWVEPNMYEELYEKAKSENADIVLSSHYINYPNGKEVVSPSYEYHNQEQYILDLMFRKASGSTWNKLFKLDTIKRSNTTYENGIDLGEDALFLFKLLLYPLKISTINKPYYHYIRDINSNSYTNNISLKTVKQNEYVWSWIKEYYTDEKYTRAYKYSTINLAFTSIRATDITKEFFKSIVQNVSFIDIIKYRLFSVKAILILATKMFGLGFGRFVYSRLYKFYYQ